jgi:hypothetical protein
MDTKKNRTKKRTTKKLATREKAKAGETFACGCCGAILAVDDCGCMETCICC